MLIRKRQAEKEEHETMSDCSIGIGASFYEYTLREKKKVEGTTVM